MTTHVIGTGPSFADDPECRERFEATRQPGELVVGANAAINFVKCDILYVHDPSAWTDTIDVGEVKRDKPVVFTCETKNHDEHYPNNYPVCTSEEAFFQPDLGLGLTACPSSGFMAMQLGVCFGDSRLLLWGYDFYYHDVYGKHLAAFGKYILCARGSGVTIDIENRRSRRMLNDWIVQNRCREYLKDKGKIDAG